MNTQYFGKFETARLSARGFSLIELVVTMLIVAILAAVAIPAYSNYVRKSRRTDAKSGLLNLAALEERYFSTQNAYSGAASDLGYPGGFPIVLGSGEYQVAAFTPTVATTGAPATYTITAVPTPGNDQVKDTQCAKFTIASNGFQQSFDSSNNDSTAVCWK